MQLLDELVEIRRLGVTHQVTLVRTVEADATQRVRSAVRALPLEQRLLALHGADDNLFARVVRPAQLHS